MNEFRDFLYLFLHVRLSDADTPLYLPNEYVVKFDKQFNYIIELSLNNYDLTDDQRKRVSQSIFNSDISEQNTPVNAIRRVMVRKNKLTGAIEEVEEDEEESIEESPKQEEKAADSLAESPGEKRPHKVSGDQLAQERVSAELSSEEEVKPVPKEKDNKKDKKKDTPELIKGYNESDIDRGKKMMENPNFKSNLDRLRSQFKAKKAEQDKKNGIQDSQTSASQLKIKAPIKNSSPEIQRKDADRPIPRTNDQQMKESDVIVGNNEPEHNPEQIKKKGLLSMANKGLKSMFKGKDKKDDNASTIPIPTEPQQKLPTTKKAVVIEESVVLDNKKTDEFNIGLAKEKKPTPVTLSKPENKQSPEQNKKEWELKNQQINKNGNKKDTVQSKDGAPMTFHEAANRRKRKSGDESDNSWDEPNPFD